MTGLCCDKMDLLSWYQNILKAKERIQSHIRHTPLEFSRLLSDAATGSKVYIKMESEQVTGSFKVRGAFNKLTKLKEEGLGKKEVMTASTGNHGMACLLAMETLGMTGRIFCQSNVVPSKAEHMKRHGARLEFHGLDCVEAELAARKAAQEEGGTYVSPYNDPDIVAGQGTIGIEILADLPTVDVVMVSVGGGGLIGGIGAYLKHVKPNIKVIGCCPRNSKVMYESVRAGRIIEEESYETLSDGTAGGVEQDSVTFPLCESCVDEWILVSEDDIAKGVYFVLENHHKIVEGAAGMLVGAFLSNAKKFAGQTVVLVSCGNNISVQKIRTIIDKFAAP